MLKTKAFFDKTTHTVTYLVWETKSRESIIIDSLLDYAPHAASLKTTSVDDVLKYMDELELKLTWALDTHAHADHLSAAHYIREKRGAKIGISARITDVQSQFKSIFMADDLITDGSQFDVLFEDNDTFMLGAETVTVIYTPGHTPACVTYLIGDMAFVGDTLFMPDYGTARADFPGGNAATLYHSIQRILSLPGQTRIMVGHDYLPEGRKTYKWETTVALQKKNNIHIAGDVSETDYVAMRNKRDLTLNTPNLILPALQVNIRAGALPPRATDGNQYLTIPINRL